LQQYDKDMYEKRKSNLPNLVHIYKCVKDK